MWERTCLKQAPCFDSEAQEKRPELFNPSSLSAKQYQIKETKYAQSTINPPPKVTVFQMAKLTQNKQSHGIFIRVVKST